MKKVKKYLKELQKNKEMGKGGRKRKPSPTFAYELVYDKPVPGGWRSGKYPKPHKIKIWNGISVDYNLEDKWLNDLNNIKTIEMRGSCEGHSKDWVSYIAFRINPKHDEDGLYLDKIIKGLSSDQNTFCGWDIGTQGRPRFVCAAKLWYGQKGWDKWWKTLAIRINKNIRR